MVLATLDVNLDQAAWPHQDMGIYLPGKATPDRPDRLVGQGLPQGASPFRTSPTLCLAQAITCQGRAS